MSDSQAFGVDVDDNDREREEADAIANAGVKTDRVKLSRGRREHTRELQHTGASLKHDSESNSIFCPGLACTATNATRASNASWSNALFANMVFV